MALIRIHKEGHNSMIIPAGAYSMYAKAGWSRKSSSSKKSVKRPLEDEEITVDAEVADINQDEDEEEEVEYVDPEELAKRPLSELDKEELRILAEYKGLDPSEYTTAKQLREALKRLE